MKYAAFRALCEKEWQGGKGGEVATLWLTQESYRELAAEAYVEELGVAYKDEGGARMGTRTVTNPRTQVSQEVSLQRNVVINPATKQTVMLRLSRQGDSADVWIHGRMETRILEDNHGASQPV